MRQVLVDMARARTTEKRNSAKEVPFSDIPDWGPQPDKTLLAMDDALKLLESTHPIKSQLIEMRYFGGMTAEESAAALAMPVHVVRRELRLAQAWMRKEMSAESATISA
jgi:RNA polymerase sigma factor (TIGR02999 family)